ncbi:cytochrome c biogenesis protein CcdA [Halanaerobium saccharolyticum]|uniref:Cytochrome c biogenesis protein CcdA n=1 Tax=Halanaerobium saccharolyticum TaxID=43595 RepID=A0A4R7Z8L8_9FIRM|nr:cytochrome c biogenesis CcdA family protein [Halanaerobium saccharolyticum]RAK09783.1 cytochrome c biogenesis protein CcdA [Halanaerobium saccharolyticum]TDW07345.1 cytochrome c biogenesis protein CcdA [Halanaerobium saccharolyticum]TDX61224.1 cytochrome c biogenesis protein CcdA [Halanaerobium saccharolyticum]
MTADLSLIAALSAGLLSFFSPCILPLIPTYLSYLVGDYAKAKQNKNELSIIITALSFIAGFTVIFVFLGLSATFLGKFLIRNQRLLMQIGGTVIIIFGLHLTGILEINYFYREKKFELPNSLTGNLRAFIMGVILAVGWTPCIGPILSSILIAASTRANIFQGGLLLFVYAVGLALPFFITALFMDYLLPKLKAFNKFLPIINKITGTLLIIFGLLMVTGYLEVVNRILL